MHVRYTQIEELAASMGQEVADDACVLSTRDLIEGMVMSPGDIPASTPDMFEFLMAAVVNFRGRFEYMARKAG